MKTIFKMMVAAIGLAMVSGTAANAAMSCSTYAQSQVDAQTHPLASAGIGCAAGLALGTIFGKGKSAQVGGCAAGAGTGVVLSASKAKAIYDAAYDDCVNGKTGGNNFAQPINKASLKLYAAPSSTANTPSTKINVRNGPGVSFGIQEKLPPYTTVTVAGCNAFGWCQVGGYQGTGWVSQSLLTFN